MTTVYVISRSTGETLRWFTGSKPDAERMAQLWRVMYSQHLIEVQAATLQVPVFIS